MKRSVKTPVLFLAAALCAGALTACADRATTGPRSAMHRASAVTLAGAAADEAAPPAEEAGPKAPAEETGCPAGFKPLAIKLGSKVDKNGNGIVCTDGTSTVDDTEASTGECPAGFTPVSVKPGDKGDVNGNGIVCTNGKATVDDTPQKIGDGKANGHGNFFSDGQDISFSFHGQNDKDGEAKGTFEMHDQTNGLNVHGEVDCLAVAGNQAHFNGVVTNSDDENLPVGSSVAWMAIDNGEGSNDSPDLVTRMGPSKKGKKGCGVAKFVFEKIVSGNIQVK